MAARLIGGEEFGEPLVDVHTSFLSIVFLVGRLKVALKVLFTGDDPGDFPDGTDC